MKNNKTSGYLDMFYEIYRDKPNIIQNMQTHDFKRNNYVTENLYGFTCNNCKCLALDIFWYGTDKNCVDISKVNAISCSEMIIKNIIE